MIIRHFEIRNYMIHGRTAVDLSPLTVFVGPNNGGKSALFDALLNFSMVSRGRLAQAFGPGPYSYRAKKSQGAASASRIGYEVELARTWDDPDGLTYHVSYSQVGGSEAPRFLIQDESLTMSDGRVLFDRSDVDSTPLVTAIPYLAEDQSILAAVRRAQFAGEHEEDFSLLTHVAREISRIGKFRLNPQLLAQASRLPDVPADSTALATGDDAGSASRLSQSLDYAGEGLASALYYMAETSSPTLQVIVETLMANVAGFGGFEFNTVGTERIGFSVKFGDRRGTVAAANLSDGTLALIGLTVLLANPFRLPVMCIEEPENGLTPSSTKAVYKAMRDVAFPAAGTAASQLLISSHSPHVITDAWNGTERDFIYQVRPSEGRAVVSKFADVIADQGIPLEKDKGGGRDRLNLRVADLVMDGYLSGSDARTPAE